MLGALNQSPLGNSIGWTVRLSDEEAVIEEAELSVLPQTLNGRTFFSLFAKFIKVYVPNKLHLSRCN